MLNFNEIIEILISLQVIIISTFIPVFISIPYINKFEIPITWQIPSIIIMTLLFKGKIIIKAFSIYLIMGLFFTQILIAKKAVILNLTRMLQCVFIGKVF